MSALRHSSDDVPGIRRVRQARLVKQCQELPGRQLFQHVDAPHGLLASHKESLAADVLAFLRGEPLPEPAAIDMGVTLLPMDPKTA